MRSRFDELRDRKTLFVRVKARENFSNGHPLKNEPCFAPVGKWLIFAGRSTHPRRGGRVRLIAHDSKSCIPSGIGGSNPPLSVLPRLPHPR